MNISYALIQGAYWCSSCALNAFAAFYLQSLGYSNTEIGIVIALASVLAFVIPLFLSPAIDRSSKIDSSLAVTVIQVAEILLGIAIFFICKKGILLSVLYILWAGLLYMCYPLCNQIALDYTHKGQNINYGVTRAFGSLAYVAASALIGILAEFQFRFLPAVAVIMQVLLLLLVLVLKKQSSRAACAAAETAEAAETPQGHTLPEFVRINPQYILLMLGLALVYVGFTFADTYMINIVERAGGTATDMGYIIAFYSFMEIPVMILWAKIGKDSRINVLLAISMVAFMLRTVYFLFARTTPMLYGNGILQLISYGMYTTAIVDYIRIRIPYEDSVKAQSLAGGMTTLAGIAACTVGGIMNDRLGLTETLVVFSVLAVVGAVLCLIGIFNKQKKIPA